MKPLASLLLALPAAIAIALQAASVEAATRKMPEPPNPAFELPMRVVIVRNNIGSCEPLCPQWVSAEGQITADSPAVFKKALAAARKLQLPIVISSPGGDVDAALIIGEMIRARHLDVAVGSTYFGGCAPYQKDCRLPEEQNGVYRGIVLPGQGFCVSACPFILASGERRMRSIGALVGVQHARPIHVPAVIVPSTMAPQTTSTMSVRKMTCPRATGRARVKSTKRLSTSAAGSVAIEIVSASSATRTIGWK